MASNEYHKQYNINRYYTLRRQYIDSMGGKCVECGSADRLQFDHIDPKTKSFDAGQLLNYSQDTVKAELKKCQLLCKACHNKKHNTAKGTHGTLSSYRYCKCEECKAAKAESNRRQKEARQHATVHP